MCLYTFLAELWNLRSGCWSAGRSISVYQTFIFINLGWGLDAPLMGAFLSPRMANKSGVRDGIALPTVYYIWKVEAGGAEDLRKNEKDGVISKQKLIQSTNDLPSQIFSTQPLR